MNERRLHQFRTALRGFSERFRSDASALSEEAHQPAGGQASGALSNTPTHLGDSATEAFLVQMNASLLQNEEYLVNEVFAALKRLDDGTFGRCEHCGQQISQDRLQAIPYTRYCAGCAADHESFPETNFNAGTPARSTLERLAAPTANPDADSHAAGTAGGGTAAGGLAGANKGDGSPDETQLRAATANSRFDADAQDEDEGADTPVAGRDEGAVRRPGAARRAKRTGRPR